MIVEHRISMRIVNVPEGVRNCILVGFALIVVLLFGGTWYLNWREKRP